VIIDVQTDRISRLLRTGPNPAEVGVVEGLSRAFVADLTDGTVTVIDTGDHGIENIVDVGVPVATVGIDEAAQRVYALDFSNGEPGTDLHVIDAVTLTEIDVLTVGDAPQWVALDPPRAKAFVTNEGDGMVSVIDIATSTVKPEVIPVGPEPLTLTIHEGAAKAYVYNAGDGTISVIDTMSETVVATLAPLFADGFESGDTSVWFSVTP